MKQAFESRLNILLSELLNQIGIASHSEFLGKGRQDVIIYHQGMAIVLEGSYDRLDAEKDARKRIEQLTADVAIAVHYPSTFSQNLTERQLKKKLISSKLPIRVLLPTDISQNLSLFFNEKSAIPHAVDDWYEMDLNFLATLITEIVQFITSEKVIKESEEEVSELVQLMVDHLANHNKSDIIATNLYQVLYKLYGFSIGEPTKIKEAIFAQSALAIFLGTVYYESIRYAHNLHSLESLESQTNSQWAIQKACTDILKIDYEPIFDLVQETLKSLPSMNLLLSRLIALSSKVASKKTLLRRDLAGKIYHKVVGDWALKKGLATFFTQVSSAYLLLYLAKPKLGRIADFACGSGTLLVAAYSATNFNHRLSLLKEGIDKSPEELEIYFHQEFLNSCFAFDVLGYATQITALNLALHSPETPIKKFTPIYTMPLGYREEDSTVSLGSLELARASGRFDQIFGQVVKVGVEKKEIEALLELRSIEPFDLIVMNPPFSRTTGRGGKAGGGLFGFIGDSKAREIVLKDYSKLRNEIKDVLESTAKKLLKGSPLEIILNDPDLNQFKNIWQAGEGLLFLYLADLHIKENGKICFVLPKGLLSGITWFFARTLIAARYHLEYVIVSSQTNEYNFSESTSLSECMFIATRKKEQDESDITKFIILLNKPITSIEAIALSNQIETSDSRYVETGNSRAFILPVKRGKLLENIDNWGRFTFLPNLTILDETESLLEGRLKIGSKTLNIPIIKFNELMESIGVDRHRFQDTFRVVEQSVPGSFKILFGGEEEQRLFMETSFNKHALPMIERGGPLFDEISGNFLIPDRIRLTTAHIISMICRQKVISNIFYAVKLKNETIEKIKTICLWLNTTWGILTVLASRHETHGAFIELTQSHWRLIPIIDVNKLNKKTLVAVSTVYDDFKDKELERIPNQYGMNGEVDINRLNLDSAFLQALGFKFEKSDLLKLYKEIAQSLKQWIG